MSDALFRPMRIGAIEIPGRLVKTATSETRAAADGTFTDLVRAFYQPMATSGGPLIITGNIFIGRDGQSTANQMGADSDDKIAGLARLTKAVHRHATRYSPSSAMPAGPAKRQDSTACRSTPGTAT